MSNRLSWIRRQTTVDDLLDDGIENFSDLKPVDPIAEESDPDPALVAANQRLRDQSRQEVEQSRAVAYRKTFSAFGFFLALALVISGALLMLFPVDMRIEHRRVKYLRSVVEHVTPARSELYGAVLVVAGLALAGYSLYRPRRL